MMSARRDDMKCIECGILTDAIESSICSHCNRTVHSIGCGVPCIRCRRSFCNSCFPRHRCSGVGPYTPEMSSVQPPPTAQSSLQPPSASELAWEIWASPHSSACGSSKDAEGESEPSASGSGSDRNADDQASSSDESWAAGLPHPILLRKVRAAWMACATAFGDKAEITLQARKAYEEEFARRQQDEPTMLQIQRVRRRIRAVECQLISIQDKYERVGDQIRDNQARQARCEVVRSELLHEHAWLATLWSQMQGGPGGMDAPLPWHSPEVQLLDVQLKIAARQLATAMGRVGQNLVSGSSTPPAQADQQSVGQWCEVASAQGTRSSVGERLEPGAAAGTQAKETERQPRSRSPSKIGAEGGSAPRSSFHQLLTKGC